MKIAGDIIIALGMVFILFGIIGLIRFRDFYTRILVTAKIDTVGVTTIFVGMAVKHGLSFFSLKVLLLIGIMMVINPLSAHMIARSAYLSGYKAEAQTAKENDDKDDL